MILWLLLLAVLALSAANGANDNIKGAATLIGSGLVDYRRAILLASAATALGGLLSLWVANGLLEAFSGRGIVPDELTGSARFLAAVGLGAGATVWLATRLGLPISTTHGLLGGLLGAGLMAAPTAVGWEAALRGMFAPLLLAPLLAIALALLLVPVLKRLRHQAAARRAACLCVTSEPAAATAVASTRAALVLGTADSAECQPPVQRVLAVSPVQALDRLHFASALAVSFARGLNDTPKIAALLVAAGSLGAGSATLLVIVAMAAGGLLASGRIANTLAFRVTRMDPAEGLGGNLVTALLVIVASRFGLPVSTTHVSTGALFGIAAGNGSGQGRTILGILGAWLLTLPLAAALAALAMLALG